MARIQVRERNTVVRIVSRAHAIVNINGSHVKYNVFIKLTVIRDYANSNARCCHEKIDTFTVKSNRWKKGKERRVIDGREKEKETEEEREEWKRWGTRKNDIRVIHLGARHCPSVSVIKHNRNVGRQFYSHLRLRFTVFTRRHRGITKSSNYAFQYPITKGGIWLCVTQTPAS